MKINLSYGLPVLMTALALCGVAAQSQPLHLLKTERQLIEGNHVKYFEAIKSRDALRFSEQYSEDCWIMVPLMPIHCGPDAPVDYFKEILTPQNIAGGRFITIDLYGVQDDMLAEVGFYQFYDQRGAQCDDGKYMTLWKRTDGQWKRFRETLTSSRPQ